MRIAQIRDALWPEEVDLDRCVERGVKRNRGGRVNDDIGGKPDLEIVFGETEAVSANVASNCLHSLVAEFGECFLAKIFAKSIEGIVLQNVSGYASAGATSSRPDE